MAEKKEVEVMTTAELLPIVEAWTNETAVYFVMGLDTTTQTDLIKEIVNMVGIVRKFHDEAAKEQGNPTIRGQKETTVKEVSAEDAAAKVKAALGK